MDLAEYATKSPIVIDNGSGMMKAGFSGDEHPALLFNSYVGRPKHKRIIPTSDDSDLYVGNTVDKYNGLLKIKYPINHGVITDFNDMELIWKHIYSELKATPKEHPVLLTEAPINPTQNKFDMAKVFFEKFNSPAIFIAVQAVLSLYAHGKTTGIVLDSGDGVTHCVPIYEGFSIQHAVSRIDLGGRDVTEHLTYLLRKSGYNFTTSSEFEVVRKIKEKNCSLSEVLRDDKLSSTTKIESTKGIGGYLLPDGSSIDLGLDKMKAPEILFSPDRIGLEYPGVHELLVNSIKKCDLELRKTLYSEIRLAGGNTLLSGFPERLLSELRKSVPKDLKLTVYAAPERKTSCWVGGSILSSLATFKKMWITKKEFEEAGERVLLQKSF